MAGTSRSARPTELQMHKRWKDRDTSPERTKVWTEPPNSKLKSSDRRVPVIYYLSRNGQLEHPHFMEVPLSSPDALYLKDVINRLNSLRGKGMASLYSWSCKSFCKFRSYKNGYVWHDLSENDFIYPAHGQEYILKGSEILDGAFITKSDETVMCSTAKLPAPPEGPLRVHSEEFPPVKAPRRRNQSWSSFDLHEYKVYTGESASRAAADASTQTDDKRRRRRAVREIEEVHEGENEEKSREESQRIVSSDEITEISPPPSDSSPETLETLMKADGRIILRSGAANEDPTAPASNSNYPPSGRSKASSVLMQLVSCGSIGFKACGPGQGKDHGFSLISHYKVRLPRGGGSNHVGKDAETESVGSLASGFGGRVKLEEKEYFSGSLIETKKDKFPALKRSSSFNADRSSKLDLGGVQEMEGSRENCKPMKQKEKGTILSRRRESSHDLSCSSGGSSTTSTLTSCGQHGTEEP
nr:protein UPSTREAM OF FLC-like isoform X1 [Coffea arabica]